MGNIIKAIKWEPREETKKEEYIHLFKKVSNNPRWITIK